MTDRKLHTRYRLVSKSMTLDDLQRPFCTLFQKTCVFGAHHENFNEDRPTLSCFILHVTTVLRTKLIRRLVGPNATATLTSAFTVSKLDYCNWNPNPPFQCNVRRTQRSDGACFSPHDHVTGTLWDSRCLPLEHRRTHKLCLYYKCILSTTTEHAPFYLAKIHS